ncbi:MAG: GWxTD domain-containing protein [Candidatus Marinimicrobia bacterium]|nr:GWxTD domain-containing protein [Candidatus Neomarinimicrobiota bacterium]
MSENWVENISLGEFTMTNSRENSFETERKYLLEPAKYRLEVLVTDLKTQNRRKRTKDIDMSQLAEGPWMIGDLYIVEEKVVRSGEDDMPEAIYIGFTASGIKGKNKFKYTLYSGDTPVKQGRFETELKEQKHEYCFPVRTKDLNFNTYILVLKTEIGGKEYQRQLPVRVQWAGSSALIPDINAAVEQMRYLAHTGHFPMRKYRSALNGDRDEKRTFFTETWKELDPTPNTERNELMNEYYYRVQRANQRFSGQREGWRSDRGMIFIIYGEPDAVEEHHMEIDTKPYIIWYYYSVNRRFIFVDYTGFGNFQLAEPISEF